MLQSLLSYLQSLSWLAKETTLLTLFLYIALVVASQTVLLPITAFDMTAGFVFGFRRGFVVMVISKALSAAVNFNLARSIARVPAQKLAARFPILDGMNTAIANEGWKLAGLLRLCPIPFGIASYAFGLTKLTNRHHIISTTLATLPPTLMFVIMGVSAKNGLTALAGDNPQQGPWGNIMLGVGILAAVLVTRRVSKIAMQSIKTAQGAQKTPPQEASSR